MDWVFVGQVCANHGGGGEGGCLQTNNVRSSMTPEPFRVLSHQSLLTTDNSTSDFFMLSDHHPIIVKVAFV